jgi:hypothetical protein
MSQYGEIIDSYTPDFSLFYDAISIFYENPKMVLLKKDNGYSMYVCKLKCLLEVKRYLFAIVPETENNKIDEIAELKDLNWEALHIKQLDELIKLDIPDHLFTPKRIIYLDKKIERIELTEENSFYKCDFHKNLKIKLIHKKEGTINQYQPTGNLLEAMETYMTVLSFKV